MRINDTPALPAPLLNAKMVRCCFFACVAVVVDDMHL
jgi:hypothetical protein